MKETRFDQNEFNLAYPDGIQRHYWSLSRNMIIDLYLRKLKLEKISILEIGCGKGIVVDYLKNAGWDCFGVELAGVKPIKSVQSCITTRKDALLIDKNFRKKINVILLLDVIEHIGTPESFILQIKNAYPNIKKMIITVPARQELWSNYDEFYNHYRRYDLKMVEDISKNLNFEIEFTAYLFKLLYIPAYIAVKLMKTKRGVQIISPTGISVFIHQLLAWGFYFECILLPANMPGTSIIAVLNLK